MKYNSKKYIIASDIGGTKISTALGAIKGKIISKNIISLKKPYSLNTFLSEFNKNINELINKNNISKNNILLISLAVAGHLDPKKGIVYCSPNLPIINRKNIIKLISNKIKIKTIIENDANAAAYGEYLFGAGKNCKSFIYLTISTGIGGGIIINGNIHHGSHFLAGEIGHMSLDILKGPKCKCGDIGCFESIASGTALEERAKKYFKNSKDKNITTKIIADAAKKNDKLAVKFIKENAQYIGQGIINLIKILDPEKIIIGGGLSKIGPLLFNEIKKEVKKSKMLKKGNISTPIIPSKLKTDEGLYGALALGINCLNKKS